jgi:hypothetical protein
MFFPGFIQMPVEVFNLIFELFDLLLQELDLPVFGIFNLLTDGF